MVQQLLVRLRRKNGARTPACTVSVLSKYLPMYSPATWCRDRVGQAVALLEDVAGRILHCGIIVADAAEDVQRVAELVEPTRFAGLAVLGAVPGIGNAEGIFRRRFVAQRKRGAETVRAGVRREQQTHEIIRIAIAIDVDAARDATADARSLAAVDARDAAVGVGFREDRGAAAIGEDILIAGIKRRDQLLAKREARVEADVAGVRRVDRGIVVVGAGRRVRLLARTHRCCWAACRWHRC